MDWLSARDRSRLQGVDPRLAAVMAEAVRRYDGGINIAEGLRSKERQRQLYAQGRTAPGNIVTNTMNSRHLNGSAVDVALLTPDGAYNKNFDDYAAFNELVQQIAAEKDLGVTWGGTFKSLRDGPHFQLAEAVARSVGNPPPAISNGQPQGLLSGGAGADTLAGGLELDVMQGPQRTSPPMQPQQQRRPSIWDAVEGTPVIGGLADPDRRARLAMMLDGMTLNPNQALQRTLSNEIDQRSDDRRRNQTAEWLATQPGGEQFAQAIRSGADAGQMFGAYFESMQAPDPVRGVEVNGVLVNPITGQEIADYSHLNAPDSVITNEINTGNAGPPTDEKRRDELMKNQGAAWGAHLSSGATAAGMLQDLEVLEQLVDVVPSGPIEGRLAQAFPGFSTAGDAFQSVVKRAAPALRVEGSGATSDIEYQGFLQSFPALVNRPEANRAIIGVLRAKAQINQARASVVAQYQNGEIDGVTATQRLEAINSQSILTPEIRQVLGDLAPATGAATPTPSEELSDEDLLKKYGG